MMRDSFLHFLFGKKKNASCRDRTGTSRKSLRLEALEDRHMLSVSFETSIDSTYKADTSGTTVTPDLIRHQMVFSADFNNDGKTDIIAIDKNSSKVYTYLNSGSTTDPFSGEAAQFIPTDGLRLLTHAAVGELTGDSNVDLITGYAQDDILFFSVYKGNGNVNSNGGFSDSSISSTFLDLQSVLAGQGVNIPSNGNLYTLLTNITLVDADGDGNGPFDMICTVTYDVVLADTSVYASGTLNLLFKNNGSGSFNTTPTVLLDSDRVIVAAGDLTGSAQPEYVVQNGQKLDIYRDGAVTAPVSTPSYGMNFIDVVVAQCHAGSGKMEIVSTHESDGNYYLHVTTVDGTTVTVGTRYQLDVVPANVITGDFNNDGFIDIFVSDGDVYQTLLGQANGTFNLEGKVIANGNFTTSHVADFNGDGIADVLAVGERLAWFISGTEGGATSVVIDFSTYGITAKDVAFGDFNADGKTDIAVLSHNGDEVFIFTNTSTSSTASFTRSATLAVTGGKQLLVANFDNAFGDDIVVYGLDSVNMTKPTMQAILSTASGFSGTVKTTSLENSFDLLTVGDATNDGYVDIIGVINGNLGQSTAVKSAYQVMTNTASDPGRFTVSNKVTFGETSTYPTAVAIGDLTGDNRNDLVILDADTRQIWTLPQHSTTSGIFQIGSYIKTTPVTNSSVDIAAFSQLAIADFNADGALDVAVGMIDSSGSTQFRILENDPANPGTMKSDTNFITAGSFDGTTSSGLSIHIGLLDGNATPDIVIVGGNTVKRFVNTDKTGADIGTVTLVFRDYSSTVVSTETVDLATLADRLSYIDEWSNFWVEIWADTGSAAGVSQFTTVLTFNTDVFEVRDGAHVVAGAAFDNADFGYTLADGKITLTGKVSSTAGTQGDNTNTMLARVSFMPAKDGSGLQMNHTTNATYLQSHDHGFDVDVSNSLLTISSSQSGRPVTEVSNDIPLFPVMYDIDDDGVIGVLDFMEFVQAFDKNVTDPNAPVFAKLCDYDRDGSIGVLDFMLFVPNFDKVSKNLCIQDPTLKVYYSQNFPGDFTTAAHGKTSALSIVDQALESSLADDVAIPAMQQTPAENAQNQALLAYIASQETKKDDFSTDDLTPVSETERLLAEGKL